MSVLHLNKLAWRLEHEPRLLGLFEADPDLVLDGFDLADTEREAVKRRDASTLLDAGMNPVALRNLLVLLGVSHGQMYPTRPTAESSDDY